MPSRPHPWVGAPASCRGPCDVVVGGPRVRPWRRAQASDTAWRERWSVSVPMAIGQAPSRCARRPRREHRGASNPAPRRCGRSATAQSPEDRACGTVVGPSRSENCAESGRRTTGSGRTRRVDVAPRNSKTASRNTSAPRAANTQAPPAASTNRTRRAAASRRSSVADRCKSVVVGDIVQSEPNRRASSDETADHRWTSALSGASAGARRARCRYRRSMSSTRAPRPSTQILMVRETTRALRATLVSAAPSTNACATASRITSTPVTFPGSASYGSTRSRCRQSRQRASATSSVTDPSRISSRRPTRLRVSRRSLPPHRAQRHPARSSSPEASTTAAYLLDSTSSTKTTCS